jgi:lysophospholipase L1-like esterase
MIDTRVSFTGTWDDVFHGSNQVTLRNNNCWGLIFGYGAASLTFTPVNQINQIDIWYYAGPAIVGGTPHFTVQVDNGTPQDVYPASNLDMQVLTLNVALGAHSVTINWVSGPIYLGPILCRNTNLISIEVINVGMSGLFASNQANMLPGYSVSGNLVARLQADVYIVNLMMNDILFNASVSSSKSSLQAYINQLLANGNCDVIMEFPNPAIGNSNLPLQPQYRDAFFDIANQMQVPLLDLYGFLANGDPNVAAAMGTNAVHPIGLGYNNIGRFEFNVLRSLWGF